MKKFVVMGMTLLLGACASQPTEISASYVSTLNYGKYDCDQLGEEATRVSRRASELHGELKKTADNDAVQMGIGLVLFWPVLFFLEGGDGAGATEYARLKGEREAIEKTSIEKKCSIKFEAIKSKPDEKAALEDS